MTEQPETFNITSDDEEQRSLALTIDYQTFLALAFDGYDAEDLRAFILQAIAEDKIQITHYFPKPSI